MDFYLVDDSFVMVFLRRAVVRMEELDIVLEFLNKVPPPYPPFAKYERLWSYRDDVLIKLQSLNAFSFSVKGRTRLVPAP